MLNNLSSAERRALLVARLTHGSPLPERPAEPAALPRRGKRSWLVRALLAITLAAAVSSGIFAYKIISASDRISEANRSILGQLKDLLFSASSTLAGEADGRINVLLIAVGGAGHKGEDLADTIMIASLKPQNMQAALLSIPRDLYVQVPGQEFYSKINAVHAYGESLDKGSGPRLLRQVTEDITGLPIHYYIRADFTAFKAIVDAVGGVNITIPNTFYDYWHKISFPAGTEKMNGERALAFVRARYIEGAEGGDFKRAARQQQVLLALREKIFSVQTAVDFTRANAILNSLSQNIRTDMALREMKRFYELARLIEPPQVRTNVLTSGESGPLTGTTEILSGVPASVLRPRTGNYSEIRQIAQNIFIALPTAATASPAPPTPSPKTPTPSATPILKDAIPETKPSLEIRNGTTITGLAKRVSGMLQAEGYQIAAVGNAAARTLTTSTVYANTTQQTVPAQQIADLLQAQSATGFPANEESAADVLILLGTDADR
ncbi:MAG: LCP family protein [Candidatus Andersenbacteria bacterium]|nr:LCP family protein [Candidatus Andersenbacteria bacterium]